MRTFIPLFIGKHFENLLTENGETGYLVGNSLTIADIRLYLIISQFVFVGIPENVLDSYKNVLKLVENVKNHPKIKEYYEAKK